MPVFHRIAGFVAFFFVAALLLLLWNDVVCYGSLLRLQWEENQNLQ